MATTPRRKTGTTTGRGSARPRRKAPAKPTGRRPGRPKSGFRLRPPWRLLLLLLLLLISLGALGYLVFLHQPLNGEEQPPATPPPTESRAEPTTPMEPPTTLPAAPPERASQDLPALADDPRPRLALIIDDMGYDPQIEEQLLALDLELTFAFIPFATHRQTVLQRARADQRPILLHLPLEALDDQWNSAPGLLRAEMSEEEIINGFAEALNEVPMAIGVNNHMGSRFTADHRAMGVLLAQLPRYDLFFLDSLTTADSVGAEVAAAHGVPFLQRDIFLDHHREPEKIQAQLHKLLSLAEERGWAVGIAHPYPETLRILRENEPLLQQRARLVGLEYLIEQHGQP